MIYASYPVFADDGALLGFTAISVPHKTLQEAIPESETVVLTLNPAGDILSAPGSLDEARVFLPRLTADISLIEQPTSFRANDQNGRERVYAIIPVIDDQLYALSTWPLDKDISGSFYLKNPALFPVLMWLASLGVALFATSLFVTRHVVQLRRAMQRFAATRKKTGLRRV